jgi:signal transduction histidine kinase
MVANPVFRLVKLRYLGEPIAAVTRPLAILVATGVFLVTAVLGVTGFALHHTYEVALEDRERELGRLNLVLAAQIGRSMQTLDLVLRDLLDRLRGLPDLGSDAPQSLAERTTAILDNAIAGLAEISSVRLVGADGTLLGASRLRPPLQSAAADPDLAVLREDPTRDIAFGVPVRNRLSGMWTLPFARRVGGTGPAFRGVIVGDIVLDYFQSFFQSMSLGEHSSVELFRRDGMLLARFPAAADAIGRSFAADELFREPLADGAGRVAREPGLIDAAPRVVSIRALRGYPLAVMVTDTAEAALAQWRHQGALLALFAVVGTAAIVFFTWLIARQLRVQIAFAAIRAEKAEAEQARLQVEAELLKKERLSVLGQLTATVAHELRNPLSAIRNTLFAVKELSAGAGLTLERPLGRMERSIERCNRIISELLEYTKVRDLALVEVDIDSWLVELLGEQVLAAGVELLHEAGAAGAVAAIDIDRLRRVLINLVDNAAQAMGDPRVQCRESRITLRTRAVDDWLELAVEDTGPGIRPEHLSHIFEPLFSTKSFGTGLGLATVKQIVTQHRGTIRIDSELGQGTRAIIRLPLAGRERIAA